MINLDEMLIAELERARKDITNANHAVTDGRYRLLMHELLPETADKLERISADLIAVVDTITKRQQLQLRFVKANTSTNTESDIEAARR